MHKKYIPHLFTLANCCLSYGALLYALSGGSFFVVGILLLASVVCDMFDGKIARFLHVQSEFGKELDSLVDGASFCCIPTVLLYIWQPALQTWYGSICLGIYFCAGLVRLARFNVTDIVQAHAFIGLPTPIGALYCATMFIVYPSAPLSLYILVPLLIGGAWLMVSSYSFVTYKTSWFVNLFLVVSLFMACIIPQTALVVGGVLTVYCIRSIFFCARD